MPDPRVTKLADVLVHYSLELKPGQQFVIQTSPLANELTLAVYAAAIKAADPTAKTLGPVVWGWCAYFYSAADGCAPGAVGSDCCQRWLRSSPTLSENFSV